MKKQFKRLGLTFVSMVLSASMMAACAKTENSGSNASATPNGSTAPVAEANPYQEHMDISVAFWDIDGMAAQFDKDPIFQDVMKKFNISIKPVNITWDDYQQKIQMWAASGQLPDIFAIDAIGTDYQRKWISQGVVKALPSEMATKYPNLSKYFEAPDIKALSVGGKYYNVPRKMYPSVDWSALDRLVVYRWDLAQKAGITKEPETWEEFQAMLKAIVDKDPEGKKITGLTSSTTKMIGGLFWLYGNPAATSDGSGVDFKWIKEDGKFVPAVFSKQALPALKNMKNMYTSNLIDPDIAQTKPDLAYDKFMSGKAGALLMAGFTNIDIQLYQKRWKNTNPNDDMMKNIKVLKPLVGPDGQRNHSVFKTYWSESYFSAQISDKKLDRIMRLYDYILSPEGKDLLTYGIKDKDYKIENGKKVPIGEDKGNKYPASGFLKTLVTYNSYETVKIDNPSIQNMQIRQAAVDYIDWILKNTKVPDYNINLTYMSTPAKDKFTVMDHDDLLKVMLSKDPVEKVWGDIVNGYKAKGLDKMIEEINAKAKE
ncbi:extracellular solute-binding protein [Paenibacillus alba]|uniref:extracellular solute-binding protein n=1 Tax=Paenibacillus alba TaxID=1197127 RepID=UPI001565A4B3|nr:extracellular solute-binding protein [Paenibacillus alba]NQX67182.1 extracellular solute-binding protein [Paenibacillus alba]